MSIVEPGSNIALSFTQNQTRINFAIGLYKTDSWQPVPVDSYGLLEPKFFRLQWKPATDASGEIGLSEKFDIKRTELATRGCLESDLE